MAFVVVSGLYRARLEKARERAEAPWPGMRWFAGPSDYLIGLDRLSTLSNARDKTDGDPGGDPGWCLVFDGYLSNATELAGLLRPGPDRSTLPHAALARRILAELGPDALHRLSGCFALAAVHELNGQALALRDRLGGRTLYRPHRDKGNSVLLGTRSAWIQRLTGEPFEPDPVFMASHFGLQSGPPPGRSAFAAVRELLPGERLCRKGGAWTSERPALNFSTDFDYRDPGDCIVRFRELLEEAVAATLPDTGDVACMLSGGLDSGPVAAIADRQLSAQGRHLQAISWRLDDYPEADERKWIEIAAQQFSTRPELFDGSPLLPYTRLDTDMISLDLPAYNAFRPLILACYARAAAHGHRVLLNANRGDELYPPYRLLNIDRIRRGHWTALWRDLRMLWRHRGLSGILTDPAIREPAARLLRARPKPPSWLTPEAQKVWKPAPDWPPECRQQAHPAYARQLFGVAMAFGSAHECDFPGRFELERRDPFQNEALVRFMLNAPQSLSFRKGREKWIMRVAIRDLLPPEIRWKARTGLLDSFFRKGLAENRKRLEQLLVQEASGWRRFVEPDWVRRPLHEADPGNLDLLLNQCVGYTLWENCWRGKRNESK